MRNLSPTCGFFTIVTIQWRRETINFGLIYGNWSSLKNNIWIETLFLQHMCIRFWFEAFSYCSVLETFAIEFQNYFNHDWVEFRVFCRNMPRFFDFISACTEICKNCSKNIPLFDSWFVMYSGLFLKRAGLF